MVIYYIKHVYLRRCVYSFCQTFQALCLYPALYLSIPDARVLSIAKVSTSIQLFIQTLILTDAAIARECSRHLVSRPLWPNVSSKLLEKDSEQQQLCLGNSIAKQLGQTSKNPPKIRLNDLYNNPQSLSVRLYVRMLSPDSKQQQLCLGSSSSNSKQLGQTSETRKIID